MNGFEFTATCPKCETPLELVECGRYTRNGDDARVGAHVVAECPNRHGQFRILVLMLREEEEPVFGIRPLANHLGVQVTTEHQTPGPLRVLARRIAAASGIPESAARQRVYRYAQRGITATEADRLAIAVGVHPSAVWGDQWWEHAVRETVDA